MVSAQTNYSKLLLITLSLFLIFPGVMAQSISFADPDSTQHRDVYIYYANGTLAGQWNTTSTGIAIPNDTDGDFMLVLKPQYSNPLDDPETFADSLYSWFSSNLIVLVSIGAVAALVFRKW
jgi:hypothetical protein